MANTSAAAFWDRIAPKYAKDPIANVEAYEASLARTMSYLGKDDSVLELGCGTGSTALRLAPMVSNYIGTDISSGMLDIAREKTTAEGVKNLSFEISDTPLDNDKPFTRILAFNLLHLMPNLDAVFAQIHRDLAPGGLFISKTPCLASKFYFRPLVWSMRLIGKAPWVGFLSPEGLKLQIASHGFEIIEEGLYPPSTPSAYIVARRA